MSAEFDPPEALRDVEETPSEETFGGGGTTSCVPKSFPTMLLRSDPLAACVGGGGITVGPEPVALPLSSRRKSCVESAEGGGAITDGAGMLSLASRAASRSGAETGGGTTATLFICTRVRETSRPTGAGAGGIIAPLRAGAERASSRETRVDAGAITLEFKEGAVNARSRETFGAGAMMRDSRTGAYKV